MFQVIARNLSYLFLITVFSASCTRPSPVSQLETTDVVHSSVKKQGISNCWIYAFAGWAESLHLTAGKRAVDLSEGYWMWHLFYEQLMERPFLPAIEEEGNFGLARRVASTYGYMLEKDFDLHESRSKDGSTQEKAVAYLNQELAPGGALYGQASRTPENITKHLNEAFGVDMKALEGKTRKADAFVVGKRDGKDITLADVLTKPEEKWQDLSFPSDKTGTPLAEKADRDQHEMLQRIMRALNDGMPVVIAFLIDFAALDEETATFSGEVFDQRGPKNYRASHMVVLEDYVVDDVPGIGTIGEGDTTPEMKAAALQGKLRYLKAKNSWGLKRAAGASDGYFKFDLNFLTRNHNFVKSNGRSEDSTPLTSVILPPGY